MATRLYECLAYRKEKNYSHAFKIESRKFLLFLNNIDFKSCKDVLFYFLKNFKLIQLPFDLDEWFYSIRSGLPN